MPCWSHRSDTGGCSRRWSRRMATFSGTLKRFRVFLDMGKPPLEIVAYSSALFFPFRLKQNTPERQNGPLETPSDLFEGHAPEHHLRRTRDDAERVWPREQPPKDDSRDPVVFADHVAGIRDCRPVLDDRSAQIHLPGPVGRAVQEQRIEK